MNNELPKPLKCIRCGYKWYPKWVGVKPKRCASCNVKYWDTPKKRSKWARFR